MTPLFTAADAARLLRASAAYHAAVAAGGRRVAVGRYLAAVADLAGGGHAAVVAVGGVSVRTAAVVAATSGVDAARVFRLAAAAAARVDLGSDEVGPVLAVGHDGGRVVTCVVRNAGRPPFAPAERSLLQALLAACDSTDLVGRQASGDGSLPPRARQVLGGLLAGQSERQVAAEVGISWNTVHGHVKALYKRFGVNSRAELLSRCLSPVPSGERDVVGPSAGPVFSPADGGGAAADGYRPLAS